MTAGFGMVAWGAGMGDGSGSRLLVRLEGQVPLQVRAEQVRDLGQTGDSPVSAASEVTPASVMPHGMIASKALADPDRR